MEISKNRPILVIAHDAGGAEIIAAYINTQSDKTLFRAYVAGPAEGIFEREGIDFLPLKNDRSAISVLIKENRTCEYVLLGTKWHTEIELIALQEAKAMGIHTVAYLESWVNYRERFGYPQKNWEQNIPHEIWVGDQHAYALAKSFFPTAAIKLVPNQYFVSKVQSFHSLSLEIRPSKILFLTNASTDPSGVFSALLETLSELHNNMIIRTRFHPSDNRGWFKAYKNKHAIEISREEDLVRDLVQAVVVIGPETTALVVAMLCGIPVVNCVLSSKKPMLPFKEIHSAKSNAEIQQCLRRILIENNDTRI